MSSIIRKNTRHLTDTVGGVIGLIDLNPRRNLTQGNLFLNVPLLNMFEEFFNFRIFFNYNERNTNHNYFGLGFNFDLNVSLYAETERITVTDFLGEKRIFISEEDSEADTFYHIDSMSKIVRITPTQFRIQENDGSQYTYNLTGNIGTLARVLGTNNKSYTVTEDKNALTPVIVSFSENNSTIFMRFRRNNLTEPVTCIDFRAPESNERRQYQIHLSYFRDRFNQNRLTQIKYYYRGKYIQKTALNYEVEPVASGSANEIFRSLEVIDHNTKEQLKYLFNGSRIKEVIKGIGKNYKYKKTLNINYSGNAVSVVNERKQKMYYVYDNAGSLISESDSLGNSLAYGFDSNDEMTFRSSNVNFLQWANQNYNYHKNIDFSGHAQSVLVDGPFGKANATQIWLTSSQLYSLNKISFKPLTLAVWARRNPGRSGMQRGSVSIGITDDGITFKNRTAIHFTETDWTYKTIQIMPNQVYSGFELSVSNGDNYGYHFVIVVTSEAMPFMEVDPSDRLSYAARREMISRQGEFYDIEYNQFNQVERARSINGGDIVFERDNFNNIVKERRNISHGNFFERTMSYTNNGRRLASETNFNGGITNYRYTNNNEDLVEIINPDSSRTNFGLDSNFRTISMTQSDKERESTHFYKYNSSDNIESVRVEDVKEYRYQYGHDLEFKGVEAFNPANNQRKYFTTFVYNKDGDVENKIYGEKDKYTFNYDFEGRIKNVIYSDYDGNHKTNVTEYAYDEANLKVTITEPDDKIEVNFDFHGNPVSLNDQEGNNITTSFESGNFIARSYNIKNEQRLMLSGSNHNHSPDNSGLISLILSQLRNTAFASFSLNTALSFMEDGVMRKVGNNLPRTRISRNLPINFVNVSNNNRLVYIFSRFPQFNFANQNISFWFRVPAISGRNVLFATGNGDNYLEVFNNGTQVSLRIGRNNQQALLNLSGLTANIWNYLGVSWRSDGRYTLTLNRQEVFGSGQAVRLNQTLNFGHDPFGSNSHNVAITHIVTKVDASDNDLESIREVFNLTRGIFNQSGGLAGIFSGESAVTHLLERPDLLNQYQVFTLNGTLKSMNGVEPFRVSRTTESFIYDFNLNRHVLKAYGGELQYRLPVRSDFGTILLKVLIEENSGEQTLLVLQGGGQVIQFYRNAGNVLGLRVGTTEKLSDLTVSNNEWHNISLSWNQNIFTINLNDQAADITNLPFNAFDNLSITIGSNRTLPGESNALMGRIGGLYISSPTAEPVSGNNLQQIFRETKKRTRFDVLGLPILEEVFEDTEMTLRKRPTYQSDNGRASGLLINELTSYRGNGRMEFDYTYDALSNVKSIKGNVNRNTKRIDSEYSYDHRNFLRREVNVNSDIEYTYDNNGNILTAADNRNSQTKRFEYNNPLSKDLLTNYSDNEKDIVFTYDEKYIGNPKTKVVRDKDLNILSNLHYQFEGRRLKSIDDKKTGEKLIFSYNSQGLRISKKCQKTVDNSISDEVKYYYDGSMLITETGVGYRLDFHYDNSGLLFAFTHTVGSIRIKYYYLRDSLLNIVGIAGPNGLVAEYQYHNAFGSHSVINHNNSTIGLINPFRYKGYYWDESCKMYYLQSRFYDPEIYRFISADDIQFIDPSRISGLNLFVYCNNNPVMGYDPSGNFNWSKFWGITSMVMVGAIGVGLLFVPGMQLLGAGILIGGAIGAFTGGISASASGGNFWAGVALGTWSGALNGALAVSGVGYLGTIGAAFGIGFGHNAASQMWVDGTSFENVNLRQAARSGATNALFAVVSKGFLDGLNTIGVEQGGTALSAFELRVASVFLIPRFAFSQFTAEFINPARGNLTINDVSRSINGFLNNRISFNNVKAKF